MYKKILLVEKISFSYTNLRLDVRDVLKFEKHENHSSEKYRNLLFQAKCLSNKKSSLNTNFEIKIPYFKFQWSDSGFLIICSV